MASIFSPTAIVEEWLTPTTDEPSEAASGRVDTIAAREHCLLLEVETCSHKDLSQLVLREEAVSVGVDQAGLRHVH